MRRIAGSNVWFSHRPAEGGTAHLSITRWTVRNSAALHVPAYTPDSYSRACRSSGEAFREISSHEQLYGGMQSNYWILRCRRSTTRGARCTEVWQTASATSHELRRAVPALPEPVPSSGSHRQSDSRQEDPVMIPVRSLAGAVDGKSRGRSSTTRCPIIRPVHPQELLPEVYRSTTSAAMPTSRDSGQSSGGIAAFTVAYNHPEISAACTPSSVLQPRFSGIQ